MRASKSVKEQFENGPYVTEPRAVATGPLTGAHASRLQTSNAALATETSFPRFVIMASRTLALQLGRSLPLAVLQRKGPLS